MMVFALDWLWWEQLPPLWEPSSIVRAQYGRCFGVSLIRGEREARGGRSLSHLYWVSPPDPTREVRGRGGRPGEATLSLLARMGLGSAEGLTVAGNPLSF